MVSLALSCSCLSEEEEEEAVSPKELDDARDTILQQSPWDNCFLMPLGHYRGKKKKRLIYFLFIFQQAIAFVLPIGHALAVAMTIGHDATIPGGITLISEPTAQ